MEPLLVRAARRELVERTPVWFMRQAGRSLPEYRAIRERHSFFEVAGTPELCAEVTLQPVRRHGVDAAVLFADIMSPVLGMGIGGELVEGKPSRDFARTKSLMYTSPIVWHALLDKLTEQFARYVSAQARAGADVIQLFDSWVGALSPADYEEFVEPYSARILAAVDVPTIHFGTGATEALLARMIRAGGDVIGIDWRLPLEAVPEDRAAQGNLDPAVLLGSWERVEAEALQIIARAQARGSHIFNLGHGVLPQTDPDVVTRLAALVQERTVGAHV